MLHTNLEDYIQKGTVRHKYTTILNLYVQTAVEVYDTK